MDPDTNEMTHLQQFMLSKEHVQEKEFAQARERRHSMLTVLLDEELLMMHAAAKGEVSILFFFSSVGCCFRRMFLCSWSRLCL